MIEQLVREAKRRILSFMHLIEYKLDKQHVEGLLKNYDPAPVSNKRPQKCESIAFVITRMVRFHGGQTSVLRLGTELAKQGMRVYYLIYKRQSVEEMEYCAKENLAGYRGRFMSFGDYLKESGKKRIENVDFVCATSWDTVSFAKKLEDAYKLYFVQDYEPYFYKYGEEFLMCRSTYGQGLHMISLGSWNRDMILKDAEAYSRLNEGGKSGTSIGKSQTYKIDVVDFPYEPREYTQTDPSSDNAKDYSAYRTRKKITIAAYVKFYGKRLPEFIPYMLRNTAKKLKKRGIELEVLYFGEAKTFKAPGGKNLGHLNRTELTELYRKADFGLVASMSNISLVPYEMHASGLPVIEFADGTYTHFLPADSAILTDITKTDIAQELYAAIKDPGKLRKMHESAMDAMKDLSWENTGKQFYEILRTLS
ncbi:MAG: glycosyltransferase family 1 protein [Lachnospiraceae bacterium]|nr:glycosyltransferase family 1 protein [Lachnospiraceae bacterium]